MKTYELTYLIPPDISEGELKALQEKINSFIQEEKGILIKMNSPIKKRLFSPMKRRSQAYITTLNFHHEPEKLEGLEKRLKSEGQVLRYMILTKPPTTFRKKVIGEKPTISRRKVVGEKVELKEIEKKLEEILGE